METKTRNLIVALAVIVALTASAAFVTVANPTAPTYPTIKTEAWNGDAAKTYIGDKESQWNNALLTVQGTVSFKSTVTTAGSNSISKIRLEVWTVDLTKVPPTLVTRLSNLEFVAGTPQSIYTLDWDTTLIPNGVYWLKIFADMSDTSSQPCFSLLIGFDVSGGKVTTTTTGTTTPTDLSSLSPILLLGGGVAIVAVWLYRRK